MSKSNARRASFKNLAGAAVLALLGVVPLSAAHAALITWSWSGEVTTEGGVIFTVGQTITGTMTFESSTAGSGGVTNRTYSGAMRSFTIDGYPAFTLESTAAGIDINSIAIRNDFFSSPNYIDNFSATLEDTGNQYFRFVLENRTTTPSSCITSSNLPTAPYSLSCFQSVDQLVGLRGDAKVDGYTFTLNLTSLRAAAVPEPGTLALLGLGLAGLAALRRRKQ